MESKPEFRAGTSVLAGGEVSESTELPGTLGRPDGRGWVPAPRTSADDPRFCDPGVYATFRVEQRSQGAVVFASGEIDIYTAPGLREAMLSALRRSARVVVDMTAVTFLDSSGLAVLIDALKSGDRGREVSPRLVGPTPLVRRVLDITRLSEMLPIHATVAEALQHAG